VTEIEKREALYVELATARKALAEAETLPEIKTLIDKADVLRHAARRAKLSLDAQNDWAEYKLDAERTAGKMLKAMDKHKGGRPKKTSDTVSEDTASQVSYGQLLGETTTNANAKAKRWKQLADLPDEEFDAYKAEARSSEKEITTAGALRIAKERKREEEKREKAQRLAEQAEAAAAQLTKDNTDPKNPQPGQWWQLGPHRLYCGDSTDPEFIKAAEGAAFAFADPPYNAGKAEWDEGFEWGHDYLADVADITAVTPGISAVQDFFAATSMPYRWSMAAWITNGMTRGALGFGNWIYLALFTRDGKLHRNAQDVLRITIDAASTAESNHASRKPARLMIDLIDLFTTTGDVVVDPFLGSGTTLFAADQTGRTCIGAELDPLHCGEIIAKYGPEARPL